jgi:phosphopantothenoylcysteine decarboxylase/phosphopantothenate--cysteine ligase
MGYAVARAAVAHGHDVVLISGPVHLAPPKGIRLLHVVTAEDMLHAVRRHLSWCHALVMAAAVADWRPKRISVRKLKKREPFSRLELERTEDILLSLRSKKGNRIFAGFAAETHDVVAEAKRKLKEKGLDLIVANDVTRRDAGFDVDTNKVTLLERNGTVTSLPVMTKNRVADRIIRWIERNEGKRS